MMVEPLDFNVVVRHIVTCVSSALEKFIELSPVAPLPPASIWRQHDGVKSIADITARPPLAAQPVVVVSVAAVVVAVEMRR